MDATTGTSAQRQKLLEEYRIALRMWSETKALYEIDSAEVSEATNNLDQLQQDNRVPASRLETSQAATYSGNGIVTSTAVISGYKLPLDTSLP